MAQDTFRDIAGKVALVLDIQSPSYERVSYGDYNRAVILMQKDIKPLSISKVLCDIELSLQGESASTYTAAALYFSNNAIKDQVITQ